MITRCIFIVVLLYRVSSFAQITGDSTMQFEEDTIVSLQTEVMDSVFMQTDSTTFFQNIWSHNPHSVGRAALFSAILPGLGQVYNGKAWKVPIVYAGLGVASGFVIYYRYGDLGFLDLRNAVKLRFDDDALTVDEYVGLASDEQLLSLYSQTKRYQDISYISLSFVYLLNIIDAIVDAHLYDFDVSDDISMKITPDLQWKTNYYTTAGTNTFATTFGLKINMHIK